VIRIAEGAAMMTDTEVEIVYKSGSTRVLSNEVLADLQTDVMRALGGIDFSDEERAYAARINAHFGDANVKTLVDRYGVDPQAANQALIGDVLPSRDKGDVSPGSTDMGDMSWHAPCSSCRPRLGPAAPRRIPGASSRPGGHQSGTKA